MPRKTQSESQDRVAELFEEFAKMVERDSGVFMGDDLNAAERKAAIGAARATAKRFRLNAERNRSIGH